MLSNSSSDSDLFKKLLLENTPLIDLRAPVEFQQGAFPTSINMPLMSDEERKKVGTCYKQHGQDAAIFLGHKLVEHDIKQRVQNWAEFKANNPSAWLYCFRGGLRSRLTVKFLKDVGVEIDLVPGGYKALRRYMIDTIDEVARKNITVVGGYTGGGKTQLIQSLANGLDIEGRANHRGSSFGKKATPQPKQTAYENQLAVDILNISKLHDHFVIEDESKAIGSVNVPLLLFAKMEVSPLVIINDPFERRLDRLQKEYCDNMIVAYQAVLGEEKGWIAYCNYLHHGLKGIRKRLGLEKFKAIEKTLNDALQTQLLSSTTDDHRVWISAALTGYYDPMYQYQLDKKQDRIQFTGTHQEVREWLAVH